MKAVLLLLALCGLSAVYAASPTAEDVRETGKVSPIDPVGELKSRPDTRIVSNLGKSSSSISNTVGRCNVCSNQVVRDPHDPCMKL